MELEDPEILAEAEASRAAAEENYATCDDQPGRTPSRRSTISRAAMEDFLLNHKRKPGSPPLPSRRSNVAPLPPGGAQTVVPLRFPHQPPRQPAPRRSTPSDAPSS